MEKKDHHRYSDEDLLQAFRSSGDNRWLGTLLQRYTVLLLGVAMKYLKDRDEAQDAVQQVFLKAVTHLPADTVHNFRGWLYVLMRNHCLQLLRAKAYNAPESVLEQVSDTVADREDVLLREQTLEQMDRALGELGAEQQQCIILFYLKKNSYQQIMEQTGFSFAQVKSFIQNGKRNLKLILLKQAGHST